MAEKNGWAFAGLDDVTAEEYDAFIDSLGSSPKLSVTTPYLMKWIVAWPLPGDPAKEESYKKLKLKEWRSAVKALTGAFRDVMGAE